MTIVVHEDTLSPYEYVLLLAWFVRLQRTRNDWLH